MHVFRSGWWRCHRAIISDYLKAEGWTVMHILRDNEAVEHPFTSGTEPRINVVKDNPGHRNDRARPLSRLG